MMEEIYNMNEIIFPRVTRSMTRYYKMQRKPNGNRRNRNNYNSVQKKKNILHAPRSNAIKKVKKKKSKLPKISTVALGIKEEIGQSCSGQVERLHIKNGEKTTVLHENITIPGWTTKDLQDLVYRMDLDISKDDICLFKKEDSPFKWEEISFSNHSPEDCKNALSEIEKALRKFRIVKDNGQDVTDSLTMEERKPRKKRRRKQPGKQRKNENEISLGKPSPVDCKKSWSKLGKGSELGKENFKISKDIGQDVTEARKPRKKRRRKTPGQQRMRRWWLQRRLLKKQRKQEKEDEEEESSFSNSPEDHKKAWSEFIHGLLKFNFDKKMGMDETKERKPRQMRPQKNGKQQGKKENEIKQRGKSAEGVCQDMKDSRTKKKRKLSGRQRRKENQKRLPERLRSAKVHRVLREEYFSFWQPSTK